MFIRDSILAGEILLLLENISGSVRIIDIETSMELTENDLSSAITRLHSEGLIDLIKENERKTIALTKSAEILERNMPELLAASLKA